MDEKIAALRQEYSQKILIEEDISPDPIDQFNKWWEEVLSAKITEPNAMTLSTASSDGMPSARIVLLKDFSSRGFVFFTNYNSYKGKQLAENPKACLVFFWKELERQVRITGLVERTPDTVNDNYFQSRPVESQIGALTSPQSQVIQNRKWLFEEFSRLSQKFQDLKIERPPHWGGYLVKPVIIEFWQGGKSRLHDRIQYSLEENGKWRIERLAP